MMLRHAVPVLGKRGVLLLAAFVPFFIMWGLFSAFDITSPYAAWVGAQAQALFSMLLLLAKTPDAAAPQDKAP